MSAESPKDVSVSVGGVGVVALVLCFAFFREVISGLRMFATGCAYFAKSFSSGGGEDIHALVFGSDLSGSLAPQRGLASSNELEFVICCGLLPVLICYLLWRFMRKPPVIGGASVVVQSSRIDQRAVNVGPSTGNIDDSDDEVDLQVVYRVVSVQVLGDNFESRATVDLAALAKKGLVPDETLPLKVVGHGEIDKELTVFAAKFSELARRKIERSGGTAHVLESFSAE